MNIFKKFLIYIFSFVFVFSALITGGILLSNSLTQTSSQGAGGGNLAR